MKTKDEILNNVRSYVCDIHYEETKSSPANNFANKIYSSVTINEELVDEKVKLLSKYNLDNNIIIELLNKMPFLVLLEEEELLKKLSFIYNSNQLYAVICCFHNEYSWVVYDYQNNSFSKLGRIDVTNEKKDNNENAIIKMIIDSTNRNDIQNITSILTSDDLEERIYKLKQFKINETGYHLR